MGGKHMTVAGAGERGQRLDATAQDRETTSTVK